MYSSTGDLFVVKEILGHKNVSTTQQYLGVGFEKLQEAMDALAEGLRTHGTADECNIPYNTLHSEDKRQRKWSHTAKPRLRLCAQSPRVLSQYCDSHAPGMAPRNDQVQKSFQRRRNASKFSRRQKARATRATINRRGYARTYPRAIAARANER